MLPRFARAGVADALKDTPIVVIQGARQVGKSTLAAQFATGRSSVTATLDDELTRAAAADDPVSFLEQAGDGLLVIDEVQRSPGLILPLKAAVDRDRRPGRFLLTGSADLLHVKGVGDSLAGRAESVELLPLSQGELVRRAQPEDFVAMVLAGGWPRASAALDVSLVTRGGYPEVIRRNDARAGRWLDNYASRLAEHDARDLHQGGYADQVGRLMSLLASGGMSEVVKARLARELTISESTVDAYLRMIRTMRLVVELPAWGRSPRSRVIHRSKLALTDTGLSAHLAGFTRAKAENLGGREFLGSLVEQFVALELLKQRGWSSELFDLGHYRDQDGLEVDIVVELRDGRLIAIEVKSGQTITSRSWAGLQRFRERFADREVTAVVLHAGSQVTHLFGWLHVLPISTLWQG
jgi:predicted AAA+ superfamily ATPase